MINDIRYLKAVEFCPKDSAPIFYVNIDFKLITNKKISLRTSNRIVIKGFYFDLMKSKDVKKAAVKVMLRDESDHKKKTHVFDLTRIEIININLIKFMSYGIKE